MWHTVSFVVSLSTAAVTKCSGWETGVLSNKAAVLGEKMTILSVHM